MKSTGEVMGVADNFGEAFAKAQIAAGQALPLQGTVFLSVNDHDKERAHSLARQVAEMGLHLVATHVTPVLLEQAGPPPAPAHEGRCGPSHWACAAKHGLVQP